jgi:Na+-driven multidrug efflux pump
MIPIMGFASATNTLVSYLIGRGEVGEVLKTIRKIMYMCASSILLIVTICSLIPEQLLSIYTNDQHLIEMGVPIVYIISVASLMLGMGNILFSGISGTGKTNVSLVIEVSVLTIYLAITAILVRVFSVPVELVWGVEVLYGLLLITVSYTYLKSKRWVGSKV